MPSRAAVLAAEITGWMIGSMIMSSTPAWAVGAVAIGVIAAVKKAPAAVPNPITLPRRRVVGVGDWRSCLVLCCLRFICEPSCHDNYDDESETYLRRI
ncbi:hypothetical protein BST29_19710 [Mycobacterium malmoense]|uniref:Secreted protein n=1 Tax=Mycobacterium malmoense TaxID=1780 RepID=A0ABX3SMA4_MYCMA|nr:hypothetical protein BST29_19710 [Mycobacterium malmoense]